MALVEWTDDLSVNVAAIDQDHKKLIALINELNDAMKQGKGKDVLSGIFDELIKYTATHFAREEGYFAQVSYADTEAHKKEHAAFVEKVTGYKEEFDNGRMSLSITVMSFLGDWLKNHISGTDKKYTAALNENGIQ